MNELRELFNKYGCDKGDMRHCYDRTYGPALEHLRNQPFNFLEIGIFEGKSIEVWLEYFPKATIYGIDIFERVSAEDIQILKHPRVKWCKCDSLKGPNEAFIEMVGDVKFDVIIDDGLHTHDGQRQTFSNFIAYLNTPGTYFIEDVWAFDVMTDAQKNHRWIKTHREEFSDEQYANLYNTMNEYTFKYHDLRQGFHDDTFIIEVTK